MALQIFDAIKPVYGDNMGGKGVYALEAKHIKVEDGTEHGVTLQEYIGTLKDELTPENNTVLAKLSEASQSDSTVLQYNSEALATQAYVNAKVAELGHLKKEVVEALPAGEAIDPDTIYLVAKDPADDENNVYLEYIYINSKWEIIGDTKTDLTGYATETFVTTALEAYTTTAELTPMLEAKLDVNQGVDNAGKMLAVGVDGNVELIEKAPATAEGTSYTNISFEEYTNVKAALDALFAKAFYIDPKITSFTANPAGGNFERGNTIAAPTFNWAVNKTMTSITIDGQSLEVSDTTYTAASSITTDKTFTLSVSDGKKSDSKSVSYRFYDRLYIGRKETSAQEPADKAAVTFTNSDLLDATAVQYKEFATAGSFKNKVFDIAPKKTDAGTVQFIAFPASWGTVSKVEMENLAYTTVLANGGQALAFTNASGAIVNYNIYLIGGVCFENQPSTLVIK